jgi:hypothetical protein
MQRSSPPSLPDPFKLKEIPSTFNGQLWNGNQAYSDTNGRTPGSQTLDLTKRNLIIICAGQSLRINQTPTAFVPTNLAKISHLNILDGAVYPYLEPLLGCSYAGSTPGFGVGFMMGRVADDILSADLADHVMLVPVAIGGARIIEYATGFCSNRIPVAMARLKARGFTAQKNLKIITEYGQGETDNTNGTTQANYVASGNTMIELASNAGFNGPWFIAQESMFGGVTASAVTAAQMSLINGTTVFQSGNLDTLDVSYRIDGTHLNDAGAVAAKTLIYNAIVASGVLSSW